MCELGLWSLMSRSFREVRLPGILGFLVLLNAVSTTAETIDQNGIQVTFTAKQASPVGSDSAVLKEGTDTVFRFTITNNNGEKNEWI